jgi:hypothetical protein
VKGKPQMQKPSQQQSDELNQVPQPIRGDLGATIMGPRNVPLERENPDQLASLYWLLGTSVRKNGSLAVAHALVLISFLLKRGNSIDLN